ncbi:MAG: hypothetical protein IKG67_07355 [Parasporobacterium sp.]|nr:hypothetical protein [Parasporobacterium sp.]
MKKTHNMIICCLIAVCMAACMIMPAAAAQAQAGPSLEIVWPDMFGDQEGILTLDPEAATWELTFENPYGAYLIAGNYSPEDGSMECTEDAGMGAFLPLDAIYAAGQEQINAFLAGTAQAVEAGTEESAAEETAFDDFDAFKTIITWDVLDFPTVFEQLPDAYNTYDTPYKGTDFFIEYTTDVYGDGVTYDKFARVYLPYGYNPEDTETKYNVLYLQHGNNCSPSNFFDLVPPTGNFKNILDNLFDPEHGLMEPCIIVCPTYYLGIDKLDTTVPDDAIAGDGRYEGIPAMYHREVVEDLIPAVESQLNVYCEDFSEEGIKATRDHRAWGGYSRGSVCTWYMFHNDLEYFRYWMPTSAPCMPEGLRLETPGEFKWTDEDAFQYLKETIDAHPDLPFFIIAQSGAFNDATAMRYQMKCFADHKETFSYGLNPEINNFYYTCADFQHVQQYFAYYLYTARNILFQDQYAPREADAQTVTLMAPGTGAPAAAAPAAEETAGALTEEIVWPDMFGDQAGMLTLDPDAQTWELDFENPYGAYHIAGTYQPDGTMECTDDAGMGTFLPLDAIFAAAKEAIAQLP